MEREGKDRRPWVVRRPDLALYVPSVFYLVNDFHSTIKTPSKMIPVDVMANALISHQQVTSQLSDDRIKMKKE